MNIYEITFKENSRVESIRIYGEENYHTWLEENEGYVEVITMLKL